MSATEAATGGRGVAARLQRVLRTPAAPYVLLALVIVASVGVRSFRLEQPCENSCRSRAAASLIFDEAYYVNAARRIAGVKGAADQPTYARAPSGPTRTPSTRS